MKLFVHKITALFLALVVLISTLSFTVHMHYCGDNLVDRSYFSEAESCGMEMSAPADNNDDCNAVKKDCCSDKELTIQGQDELKLGQELQLKQQQFAAAFLITCIELFEPRDANLAEYSDYLPPPLIRKRHKLDEVYLI